MLKEASEPEDEVNPSKNNAEYSISNPFFAKILHAKHLTHEKALKKCLHLELDISNSGITFIPGDSFGILCPNSSVETEELLKKLKVDPTKTYILSVSEGKLIRLF